MLTPDPIAPETLRRSEYERMVDVEVAGSSLVTRPRREAVTLVAFPEVTVRVADFLRPRASWRRRRRSG